MRISLSAPMGIAWGLVLLAGRSAAIPTAPASSALQASATGTAGRVQYAPNAENALGNPWVRTPRRASSSRAAARSSRSDSRPRAPARAAR